MVGPSLRYVATAERIGRIIKRFGAGNLHSLPLRDYRAKVREMIEARFGVALPASLLVDVDAARRIGVSPCPFVDYLAEEYGLVDLRRSRKAIER